MALISCPECGNEISDKAHQCPKCGFPIQEMIICEECGTWNRKDEKSCVKCGYPFEEQEKCAFCDNGTLDEKGYCNSCGMDNKDLPKIFYQKPITNMDKTRDVYYKKPEQIFPKIEKEKANGKRTIFWVVLLIIGMFAGCGACSTDSEPQEQELTAEDFDTYAEYVESKRIVQEEIDTKDTLYENIELPEQYKEKFYIACQSCGIVPEDTKKFEKLDDWSNGQRYAFYYDGGTHNVYLLDNGEIESINYRQDSSVKLYELGYEPLNIDDFTIDMSVISRMQVAAENVIKTDLNYPDTANFDWWTTGTYSRYYDYYILQAEFSAENAFGVEERHSFRVDCTYNEIDGSELVYYELDGSAQAGIPSVPEIIKTPIENSENNESGVITLTDGVLGEYGHEDDFSGYKVIRYYIPSGKYNVRCQTKGSGFYIETIAKHLEDGYETSDIIQQIMFESVDDSYEIKINEGECISLIINSVLDFEEIQ